MDGKIKFGFSKTTKKAVLVNSIGESNVKTTKVELIEAIEGTAIKITGKTCEDEAEKKLVIPMTNDQKTTPLSKLMEDRLKRAKIRKIKTEDTNGTKPEVEIKQEPMEVEESIDQQAARELMEDLQKKVEKTEVKIFEVPMNPDDLPLEGAKESSMDDYDRVPIGDFGKAMLRGMGWKDEEVDNESKKAELEGPVLRPKGMGLGADKVIKKQPLLIAPNQSEKLEIKRNACVKILAGKHKNLYGTIEGFDDGGGRVVVKLAIGGLKVTLNEFIAQPVSKQEFATYGKILNAQKFDDYKSGELLKNPPTATSTVKKENDEKKVTRSRSRDRQRRDSRDRKYSHKSSDRRSDRHDDSSRKYHGRSRSREKRSKRKSSSSEDRSYKKKSSKHKFKRNDSSPDSRSSSGNEKKHKKKTKRSKHKRDRS